LHCTDAAFAGFAGSLASAGAAGFAGLRWLAWLRGAPLALLRLALPVDFCRSPALWPGAGPPIQSCILVFEQIGFNIVLFLYPAATWRRTRGALGLDSQSRGKHSSRKSAEVEKLCREQVASSASGKNTPSAAVTRARRGLLSAERGEYLDSYPGKKRRASAPVVPSNRALTRAQTLRRQ